MKITSSIFLSFLSILLLSLSTTSFGQQYFGQVFSNKKLPVNGAQVSLYKKADSTILGQTITDEKGYFSIKANNNAPCLLKTEAWGYITLWQEAKTGSNEIILKTDNKLSEISITARKPVIEQKVDRTIFNVENSASTAGTDAYTLLKKTPNVQLMQGQIMVAGKSGVAIMFNGRLQQLSGDDLTQFLHSIPSDNISKIEVITTPGAKYDAEGNNGIINIVTKRNLSDGFKGSLSVDCTRNHYYSPSANTSLLYHSKHLNLFVNAGSNTWNWLFTSRAHMNYGDESRFQKIDQEYSIRNSRIQIGGDYSITPKSILGFAYTKGFGGTDSKEHVSTDIFGTSFIPDSTIRTEGTTHDRYKGKHTANLNYEYKIDSTGKKLNIDADYFTQQSNRNRDYVVTNYIGEQADTATASQNRISSGYTINISSLKADLELPYSFARLSVGAKAAMVSNDGYLTYFTASQGEYIADSNRANHFLYDEKIYAAYINAQRALGKIDLQAGLRAEYTWNRGYTPATNEIDERSYLNLFPSFKLLYKYKDESSLAFTYQRRINRPSYNQLNPFRFYYTENSYTEGNPQLQPSFSNILELSWFIDRNNIIRFKTNLTNNYWDRLYFTDSATNSTVVTRMNVGSATYYSLNYNLEYSVAKWWDLSGNIGLEYSNFRMTGYGQDKHYEGYSAWIDISNSFYLNKKKTLLADLHAYYYSPRQKDYKRWDEMSTIDGGIRALLMHKNLILGVSFEDPFAKAFWLQTNLENGTSEYTYDDARIVTISATFKFGNNKLKARKDRLDNNEEIMRARSN